MKKLIFVIVFVASLFCLNQTAFAYDDKTTHPALTDEIIKFYNTFSNKKITDEEKEWIIQGSILEDTAPRYNNHFYDPIYKTGWQGGPILGFFVSSENAVSALNWVHNQELQDKYKDYRGNQTWEKALYEYVKTKDKRKALTSLGYVLHLMEDMAVPDHTRNDTHVGDSPYENYATKFTRGTLSIARDLRNQNVQSFKFDSLDQYFETVADYSNGYFFSKDTINDPKYENPKIVDEDKNYAYGRDKNQESFPLSLVRVYSVIEKGIYRKGKEYSIDDKPIYEPILDSYFSHLSREAVLAGSGVVDLFFKEAEKMEKNLDQVKAPPENSAKIFSLLGRLVQAREYLNFLAQETGKTVASILNEISGIFTKMPANVVSSLEENNNENITPLVDTLTKTVTESTPKPKEQITQPIKDIIENKENILIEKTPVVQNQETKKEGPPPYNPYYGAGYTGSSSGGPAPDVVPPVITINGSASVSVFKNSVYNDAGVTALDDVDGVVIVDTTGTVDTSTLGDYIITYTAKDSSNNTATKTRTVAVIADTTAPVITLNGNQTESVRKNLAYSDLGATALDDADGIVSVNTSGTVDTSNVGTYTITYTATDSVGNSATKTRTVVVDGGALLDGPNFVTVSGNYAYVVSENSNSLEIIDISNPAELVHKGSIAHGTNGILIGMPKAVAVSGNYAYVVSYSNSLEILDISNPILPVHKGTLNNGDGGARLLRPTRITISGNYAFVSTYGSQVVEIVDISDPANPVHKNSYSIDGVSYPTDVFVSGDYMYIAYGIIGMNEGGLRIVNISNLDSLTPAGLLINGVGGVSIANPQSIYLSGNYAYITSRGTNGLEIVDISNPLIPIHKTFIQNGDTGAYLHVPTSAMVSGNYAYVSLFNGSALEILDVSNPATPSHVSTLPNKTTGASLNYVTNVFISGNYAYLTSFLGDALEIVDISNPNNPIHAGKISNGEFTHTTSSTIFSPEKKILSFDLTELIPNVIGVIDEGNHTVTLTVPAGTNVTSLSPSFSISANSASIPGIGEGGQDFTNPKSYLIYAEDGTTQNYIVTVNAEAPL